MRSGGTWLVRGINYAAVLVGCMALIVVGVTGTAHALGTSVQATVDNGDIHPALSLTNVTPPLTVTTMPLELAGSLESLTQIQVYVDDIFSVTIPLNTGATSFSTTIVIPSGTHAVKLVGISAFSDVSPTVSIAVTYAPPQPPDGGQGTTTSSTDGSNTASGSNQGAGGIIINPDGSTSASTTYIAPTQTTTLPNWLYTGLLAVDIARPGSTDGEVAAMAGRVLAVSSAAVLIVFARPVMYASYLLRYKWFGLRECRLAHHGHRAPSLHFRVIGILLIFGVFAFS